MLQIQLFNGITFLNILILQHHWLLINTECCNHWQGEATGTGQTAEARKAAGKEAALNRKRQSKGFEADRRYTTNQRLQLAIIVQSKALATIHDGQAGEKSCERTYYQVTREGSETSTRTH
jgi:hypothetical protein